MIQCHILREPICKSSAATGIFRLVPPSFEQKLGLTRGKNKDFGPGKEPRNPAEIAEFTFNPLRSLFRSRRWRQAEVEIARFQRISSSRNVESSEGSGTANPGRQIPFEHAGAF